MVTPSLHDKGWRIRMQTLEVIDTGTGDAGQNLVDVGNADPEDALAIPTLAMQSGGTGHSGLPAATCR